MGTVGDYSRYKGLTFRFTDTGNLVVLLIFVSEILEQCMYWWGFPLRHRLEYSDVLCFSVQWDANVDDSGMGTIYYGVFPPASPSPDTSKK